MKFSFTEITRKILSLAAFSVPLTLLVLSACGGGGGGGGSAVSGGAPTVGAHMMGGAIQGVTLKLAQAPASAVVSTFAGLSPFNTGADGVGGAASFQVPYSGIADGAGNLYVADMLNNTIRKIVIATGAVTTLAGAPGVAGATDGTGAVARFNQPTGLATDGASLYVADSSNNKIRKITPASGTLANMTSANAVVTSLTGTANTLMVAGAADGAVASAQFSSPFSLAIDSTHANLYVSDHGNNKIRKIALGGLTVSSLTGPGNSTVVAGATESTVVSGVLNTATVSFNRPAAIALDSTDTNLYVADYNNNKIRVVKAATGATASLTGVSGLAVAAGATDSATAASVSFKLPVGLALDSTNANLYVTDSGNNKIRKVSTGTGATSSFTGTANTAMTAGFADGAAANATFNLPFGVVADGANLYVADSSNYTIRQIVIASGQVTTLAGVATSNYDVDATGKAARFSWPSMGATDGVNFYVATCGWNNLVRKVEIATGKVTTLAGVIGVAGSVDGPGTVATFKCPTGITTDGVNLYVVDNVNSKIRRIAPTGGATLATMTAATAMVTSLTGASGVPSAATAIDGPAASATFNFPWGITTDGVNLFVADGSNNKIRRIAPAGGATLSTMTSATATVTSLTGASGVASAATAVDGPASTATFNYPNGITTDGAHLFVADWNNNKIRMVAPAGGATLSTMTAATATVTSLTGASSVTGAATAIDGPASGATFNGPGDITTDGTNLYVSDTVNNKIRMIAPAAGATLRTINSANAVVTSITGASGVAGTAGYADGVPSAATFNWPQGIITDGVSLYVSDDNNNAIRKIK